MRRRPLVISASILAILMAFAVNLATDRLDLSSRALWVWLGLALLALLSVVVTVRLDRGGQAVERGAAVDLDEVADELSVLVGKQWRQEQESRRISDPFPLPIRWRAAAPSLMDHWANIRCAPAGEDPGPLHLSGTLESVVDFYRRIPSRRLVVLGRTGAGKTVLSLRLLSGLIGARKRGDAVPILVELRSWDPNKSKLTDWLTERLVRAYPGLAAKTPLGSSMAAALVDSHRILPILDGFDEIGPGLREKVLETLNVVTLPLVLLSRVEEYAAAVADIDVLTAAAVVEIDDLALADVAAYLPRTVRRQATGGRWSPVLAALRDRPGAPETAHLAAALSTPLMVFLARIAYSENARRHPAELLEPGRFPTTGDIEEHLIAQYISAVYDPPGGGPRPYDPKRARTWLAHLAWHLDRRGTPDLAWWQLASTVPWRTQAALAAVLVGPAVAVFDGPWIGLAAAAFAAVIGALWSRYEPDPTRIRVRPGLRPLLVRLAVGGAIGFVGGLLLGLILFLAFGGGDAMTAVAVPLFFGLMGIPIGALIWVMWRTFDTIPLDLRTAANPAAVLRRDRLNTIIACTLFALWLGTMSYNLGFAGFFAGAFLLACFTRAWGRWIILCRGWLPLTGRLPWALPAFLEEAHRCGVLRQTGAYYQFRHARLRDHLLDATVA